MAIQELQRVMEPLARAATALPPTAFRADPLVAITAFGRYLPQLLQVTAVCLNGPELWPGPMVTLEP